MKLMRVQAVLSRAGILKPSGPWSDEHMRITCPDCGTEQTLGDTTVTDNDGHTCYRCVKGCRDLVIVSPVKAGSRPMFGRGYRIDDFVLWNAAELIVPTGGADVLIPVPSFAV